MAQSTQELPAEERNEQLVCPICLGPVKQTRHTSFTSCGHVHHHHCLVQWKERGNETCPVCRTYIGDNDYRVVIRIENRRTDASDVMQLTTEQMMTFLTYLERTGEPTNVERILDDTMLSLEATSFNVNVGNDTELRTLLENAMGVPFANVNPLVLNTE